MRYVSPETRLVGPEAAFAERTGRVAQLWENARESMDGGRFWTAALVLLLTITVARSTTTVNWVPGIEVITPIALAGALLMGVLALTPVRDFIALGLAFVLAPVGPFAGAWPQIPARHPTTVPGLQPANAGGRRATAGAAGRAPSFFLVPICLPMWVT